MGRLIGKADTITPNLTEACILTGTPYRTEGWKRSELETMASQLQEMGPDNVVITGAREGDFLTNTVAEKGKAIHFVRTKKAGEERPGTGDIFSSIVAGGMVSGEELTLSVKKAARFIGDCIKISDELSIPRENGEMCIRDSSRADCGRYFRRICGVCAQNFSLQTDDWPDCRIYHSQSCQAL